MKLKYFFLALVFMASISCNKNDDADYEFVQVATPQLMSKSAFRSSVKINAPKTIEEPGKIYVYQDYIFVGDKDSGIHIIDNTNPEIPKTIAFIEIPGNEDISVKDNFLYADSATDLVVFNISDINNVTFVERLEDVFSVYDYAIPVEAETVEYGNFDRDEEIIVGWTVSTERRKKSNTNLALDDGFVPISNAESVTGVGGSLARFQIVENYLYAVGNYEMTIFNIQNLSEPVIEGTQYAGWNIETMFQADGYLYLGSTNGMYIYNLVNPSAPEYVSEFTHWEGCDPVVVNGNYAYLTLRGGNLCGQLESVLEVIDISDKANPTLATRYNLENPYGLGIKSNMLYVCDGVAGLKLFEIETPKDLKLVNTLKNIQAKDVIPLEDKLIMIGGNTIYQYQYNENNIGLISTFKLN
ncbi:LVIVD repeat-containing protein [Algibacter sp. PT7-4]|uniref:LVIVD repeat-containing protein n=1 Tax=Algibacter ulvanivorans TaxID=3400999 RepID=UPI003AAB2E0A